MSTDEKRPLPTGIFAAALTPLRADLSVNHEALAAHCRWLLANGCDGVAPLGSTGEANSLSTTERMELLDRLIEAGLPPEKLLVGTGCCAVPDTVALTRHAVALGVGGVLLLPPFYYKGVSDDGIVAAIDGVVQGVGDSRLDVYLYHFPRVASVCFSNPVVERLISAYPDIVVGMKDSSGDREHLRSVVREFPGFRVYPGTEAFLLEGLEMGAAGCISATTNVTCRLAADVSASRDPAAQERLTAVRLAFQEFPFVPGLKRTLADRLGDEGWRHLRPPFVPLTAAEAATLTRSLEALEFELPRG